MHVVIVGCGRVGSSLAHNLVDDGHTVAIIDRKSAAFERLRPGFSGEAFAGIGFDRDLLVKAGIERADALAAVTNGDNSNILVARVARETFGIEREEQQFYIGYEYMGYWILFDMRSASFYSMMYCEEKVDYTLAALETWLFSQCEGELNWDYHNELKMLDPQLG